MGIRGTTQQTLGSAISPLCLVSSPEKNNSTVIALVITVHSKCADDWHPFRGYCYKPVFGRATWHKARENCQNIGGELASIHSKAENDFIFSLLSPKVILSRVGWIGYIYWYSEKTWKWEDGHTWASKPYANWNTGEPNYGSTKPNCAHMRYEGKWNDHRCNDPMPSICKVG